MDFIAILVADVNSAPRKVARIKEIADEAGLPRSVVRDLYYGNTTNPRMTTVRAMDAWAQKSGTQ